MQKHKLVTFGCSITFGHYLPDINDNTNSPSKLAWPQLLGDFLDYDVDNQSIPGCSNFQILYNILNYKFNSNDCVVVMWSFTDRDMLFRPNSLFGQKIVSVGMWQNTELSKNWEKVHSSSDIAIRTWYYMHYANLYLESLGVNCYNTFARFKELKQFKPKNLKINYHDIKIDLSAPDDFATDLRHPGTVTNFNVAYRLNNIINIKTD